MKEYLEKRAVEHAVLHHSGDAAIVAVREIKPAQVIPVEYIREYIKAANMGAEYARQAYDIDLETQWNIRASIAREIVTSYAFGDFVSAVIKKDECCDYDE